MSDRTCKRCLTRELADQAKEFQNIRDYIDNLDVDIKSPDELYEERLSICKECDMLLAGMCRKCGCYVEFRAAFKNTKCPNVKDRRW